MSSIALVRGPAGLLVAVTALIGLVWYALGRPAAMPATPLAAGGKLDCVAYEPFPAGQPGAAPPAADIERDVRRIASIASCVRTYAARGLERVPEAARKHGLTVLQGIALGRDAERNAAEIDAAVALVRAHRPAIRALVVGNEVLSRRTVPAAELASAIRRVRAAAGVPVTFAELWQTWLEYPWLAQEVDFVTIHVPMYLDAVPVPAAQAARHVTEIRARLANLLPGREVHVGGAGWPSAGPMREAARPSRIAQARVLHELTAAARAGNFRVTVFEALDQPWRAERAGPAAPHWGLIDADRQAPKFAWGASVSEHPHWFVQALLGIMLAFVTFAAAFLSARSAGPDGPQNADWLPAAVIALCGGLFIGWAVVELPLQSRSPADWAYSAFLVALAAVTPPVAAAAAVRNVPYEGFAAALELRPRGGIHPLGRLVALLLAVTAVAAIQLGLVHVFDPGTRDFHFAPLTGPAAALALLAVNSPLAARRETVAASLAAAVLAAAAIVLAFNETAWNWQAQWLAGVLLLLAWACWRARGEQTRG